MAKVTMNIAIFADLHGRVLLAFKLCQRWQQETGETIDLILQAGDLGVFPNVNHLDKATMRHAQKDSSELGFHEFFTAPNRIAEEVLDDLEADMIFVRGNHEDHGYLDGEEGLSDKEKAIFSVDCYQRVWCIKGGMTYTFQKDDAQIQILGVGRVDEGNTDPKNIQPYEEVRALDTEACDILFSHDVGEGLGFFTRTGASGLLRLLVDELKPVYHIFGHVGESFGPQCYSGSQTIGVKMADCTWELNAFERGPVQRACMGILRWQNSEHHELEVIDEPWMDAYRKHNWVHI